ncbi:MAG: peptide-methionine (R)-S-oxide reductase MsrB [Candidatus Lokiarchaeota archaeon]|nr:peptide-methionine (R)-S-oxide reductase MsrB [Candidatus Lokiarchaeota archaeon]
MTSETKEKDWKDKLTKEQYNVLRKKGTERPFTGKYWNNHDDGVYKCAACGSLLFSSDTKFESGTGWPSFSDVMDNENIELKEDRSYGMVRTEVSCKNCGGHLGHLFMDGPKPTKCRYCINSVSLDFVSESR